MSKCLNTEFKNKFHPGIKLRQIFYDNTDVTMTTMLVIPLTEMNRLLHIKQTGDHIRKN